MTVPFVDLKREHNLIKDKINERIEKVIYENSNFILGKECEMFEKEFANYCGKEHAIGVNSGTDALELALLSLNIHKEDEVILPVNTAIPTAMAVSNIGATPVFSDIREDFLIDPADLEKRITKKTKAIIPVHLYGLSCDMNEINKIAKDHNLPIIEDCAQAHGSEYNEKRVPIGEIGCFSFYPTKNLGALGDGGMIVTSRKDLAEKLRLLRNYGQESKYYATIVGRNTRLDEVQAGVLRLKLGYLDEWNSNRIKSASIYDSELSNFVDIPLSDRNKKHIYHVYVIRTDKRDELMKNLEEHGIGTLIHYPLPLHLQKAFKNLGYNYGDFPIAEKFAKEIVSIPMFPNITPYEINEVSERIKSFKRSI